jgi:hypothetical protein
MGLEWLRKAASHGLLFPIALLGDLYFRGNYGVEQDSVEARVWLSVAAEANDAPSQYLFSYLLEFGEGGEQNQAEAKTWLERSAQQGFEPAKLVHERNGWAGYHEAPRKH